MTKEPGIWEIAVLSLLREAPMHPYQMQRLLRLRHKDEILVLKRGSLYHAIGRLLQAGLIVIEETGRDGNRPERTTYALTSAGAAELKSTMRRIVATPRRECPEFMAAMSFLLHLEPKEAVAHLRERTRGLDARIAQCTRALESAPVHVQRINLLESEYLLEMLKAERGWTSALAKEIDEGSLTWNLKAILRDAAASRRDAAKAKGRKRG